MFSDFCAEGLICEKNKPGNFDACAVIYFVILKYFKMVIVTEKTFLKI